MMGIYIKGIEMPKNCFDCMFHWHGDGTTYCLAQSKMHDLHHIKWQCKGYEEQMKYREPTCPLVPVPPNGRLIDASEEITVQMYDEQYEDFYQVKMTIDDLLSQSWIDAKAPTVIEAEEEICTKN